MQHTHKSQTDFDNSFAHVVNILRLAPPLCYLCLQTAISNPPPNAKFLDS